MPPRVVIRNETKRVFLRVTGTTVAIMPPYPGSASIPANVTHAQAIALLDENKANKSEVPTLEAFNAQSTAFEEARATVDGFGGQLEGLQINQEGQGETLASIESQVQSMNSAGLEDLSIDAQNNLIATYDQGDPKNFGFFPAMPTYKGSVSARPTVAGTMGDFYLNIGPALDVVGWLCTTSGAAGVAVWTARGGKVYEDMPFEFTSNDTYDYPVATARTVGTPQVWGAAATVAWSYAVGTGAFGAVTFPHNMAAGSVLRATVTGLATGTKRYAVLARTA